MKSKKTPKKTYVTDNSDKLYISREVCVCLQMITDTFPTIGDTNGNQTIHTLNDGPPANDSNASGLATEMQLPTPSDATISSYKAAIPCK